MGVFFQRLTAVIAALAVFVLVGTTKKSTSSVNVSLEAAAANVRKNQSATTTTTVSNKTAVVSDGANNKKSKNKKLVIFVHFHKAAGSSIVSKFGEEFAFWQPNRNGNPWEGPSNGKNKYLVEFWTYPPVQFQEFVDTAIAKGVEFLAMEWNFFVHYPDVNLSQVDLVTCLRDPYDRFVSNLFFENQKNSFLLERFRIAPREWIAKNLTSPIIQNRTIPFNYNKPNYYVAFLNGLNYRRDIDFSKLYRTHHLKVAKQRLSQFAAVLILEQPETHLQLSQWLSNNVTTLPEKNKNHGRNTSLNDHTIAMTRDEFYSDNVLDFELYEYAKQMATERLQKQQ